MQNFYYDSFYTHSTYQIPRMFPPPAASAPPSLPVSQSPSLPVSCERRSARRPTNQAPNRAIYLAAPVSSERFSCLLTERIPDLHLINGGQCFPRYTYRRLRE